MFESLTKHLPAIENAEGFGNWVVDRESKGTMDDPIKMPYGWAHPSWRRASTCGT